jgi:hypothetical protein
MQRDWRRFLHGESLDWRAEEPHIIGG